MRSHQAPRTRRGFGLLGATVLAAALLALAGCGPRGGTATQTAAKVGKGEITVHQINFILQQQRGLRPEQADAASRQVLDRLIDQELAVQKADALDLDRDPRVLQSLEAARREVLARAYADKVAEGAAKPTAEEIARYYADKPELFSQRRIYSLQELTVQATPRRRRPCASRWRAWPRRASWSNTCAARACRSPPTRPCARPSRSRCRCCRHSPA